LSKLWTMDTRLRVLLDADDWEVPLPVRGWVALGVADPMAGSAATPL
jgi:hypothetical protein